MPNQSRMSMSPAAVALSLWLAFGPAVAQAPKASPPGHPPASAAPKKASDPAAGWTGDYNGLLTGMPGERTTAAVKSFQKSHDLRAIEGTHA
jgi:hypothetical protein